MLIKAILRVSASALGVAIVASLTQQCMANPIVKPTSPAGDYVEARTASVFAGACHYSGEYMSDGREAIMAWHFSRGAWKGVSLAGLTALAVVRADTNLAETSGHHHTCLYIDTNANPAQRQALAAALETRYANIFGDVTHISPAAISFTRTAAEDYRVTAPQIASLNIKALPDRACCKMPNLVWYKPLAPIDNRRVGFTQLARCTDQTGGDAWSRGNENSAFYGTFKW
jgi:hypothetical protein